MTYTQSVVLGLVQGLTEFLPVSSSGHLILVPLVFGWPDQGLAFDAVTHLGTLAALLAYFRGELRALVSGTLSRRLALLIVVATIPAGLAGLLFGKWIETHVRSALRHRHHHRGLGDRHVDGRPPRRGRRAGSAANPSSA